jgi:hypothetical protein
MATPNPSSRDVEPTESAVPDVHTANFSRTASAHTVLVQQRLDEVTHFRVPMSVKEYFKLPNANTYYNAPDGKEYFNSNNGKIYGKRMAI